MDNLRVKLDNSLPAWLLPDSPTALFCFGHCFDAERQVTDLVLRVDGVRHRPSAIAMPRRDLYEWLSRTGQDPGGRSYRSGFWAIVPVPSREAPGAVELEAAVRLEGGGEQVVSLGTIAIRNRDEAPWTGLPPPEGAVAICMATFNPDLDLFAQQIGSIREQTDGRWVCVISDDGTDSATFDAMLEILGGDPRFEISCSEERQGPYRNFERALAIAPEQAELIAVADQDDRWYPDKLETLRGALGTAVLAFSDQRLVTRDGRVLRDTLWEGRRNDHENLASLLVANAIPGAAMLLRREVAHRALPFPDAPRTPYHDHWLALAALAQGRIAYVDRPLYDYVQHEAAVSGDLLEPVEPLRRTSWPVAGSRGWRAAYFGGYVSRAVMAQTLLLRGGAELSPGKRRALRWFVASERSPGAFLWLAARPLRRLFGRDETLGGELPLIGGIVWRHLLVLASLGSRRPGRRPFDASFPDPPRFEQPRLRRWRAGA